MTKPCRNCETTNATDFYETQGSRYCKTCHKARYFERGRQRNIQAKLKIGACVDCGLKVTPTNCVVFEWDHLRDKTMNISTMVTMCDTRFEEELEKCELRCSNCHRLQTQKRERTWATPGRPRKPNPHVSPPNTSSHSANTHTLPDATLLESGTHP